MSKISRTTFLLSLGFFIISCGGGGSGGVNDSNNNATSTFTALTTAVSGLASGMTLLAGDR